MFVKICGTTSLLDAQLAIEGGADAVGFVFAPSKRQISVEQAAKITAAMPEGVARVGVFNTPAASEILRAAREARLTAVQLHMPQESALLASLAEALPSGTEIWQVVTFEVGAPDAALAEERFERAVLAAMRDPRIAAIVLDTSKGGSSGGSGTSFPWERAAPLVRQAEVEARRFRESQASAPTPVIVAGGLSAENVAEAIAVFAPWGVDCVSGVEAEPGRKDLGRLQSFVNAARADG